MRLLVLATAALLVSWVPAHAQRDTIVMEDPSGRLIIIDRNTHEVLGYARERDRPRRARRRGSFFEDLLDTFEEPQRPRARRRGDDGLYLDERERRARRRAERRREALLRRDGEGRAVERPQPRRSAPVSTLGNGLKRIEVARLQIMLDRDGFSPGEIDGRIGSNVRKAVAAWQERNGPANLYDPSVARQKLEPGGSAFRTYKITGADISIPLIASVPVDYARKAALSAMSYTSIQEMLAERFHVAPAYLRALNPDAKFSQAGETIRVPNVGGARTAKVSYLVADKAQEQLRAFDRNGKLVAAYPATIGSSSTPSPSGQHKVERIALDPEYLYNPRVNFQQGDNTEILRVPPGPNGPVGSVWIALSKKTYGIHGTPDPGRIGKTNSNGCIRLTNWDARELAGLVQKGVRVEFVE